MPFATSNEALFAEDLLTDTLRKHLALIDKKVSRIPKNQFLASTDEDIVEHLRPGIEFSPLVLMKDDITRDDEETEVHIIDGHIPLTVPGIRITFSIPYIGMWQLWKLQPRSHASSPVGSFHHRDGGGVLTITIEEPLHKNGDRIQFLLQQNLQEIDRCIDSQRREIESHNSAIDRRIRQAARARREQLEKYEGIVSMLNIPLRPRSGEPSFQRIPLKRQLVRPLPQAKPGYQPEPGISTEDYEHVLNVIRHAGRSFEVTPKTFSCHNEEELRDIILASLNTHYYGSATGETFRKTGKTDIRIEDNSRAAFVGECKMWHGAAELLQALDQLCGYLTWRDCKTALIVFNRDNARFNDLLLKLPQVLSNHERIFGSIDNRGAGEWRCRLREKEDDERLITTHVFLFDLYIKESEPSMTASDSPGRKVNP